MITTIPVQPDPDTARGWLQAELADPAYTERVDLLALILRWVQEKWQEILEAADGRLTGTAAVVVVGVVLVVALLTGWVAGPLRRHRAARRRAEDVFGDDERTAAELRAAADAAAATGDWARAVVERFRGLLRALDERTVIDLVAGSTAQECAATAATRFPERAIELDATAVLFDDVRYGDRAATEADARAVADLDEALADATPAPVEDAVGPPEPSLAVPR